MTAPGGGVAPGGAGPAADLSIVVVNWNTAGPLEDCLASLPAACAGLTFELLVVDNASRDGSAALVRERFPEAVVIEAGANLGFAGGNNLALPRCRGAFVLLLNPDTVCPPGSLARLVAFARGRRRLGAAGPLLTDAEGRPTISWGWFPAARHHWLGCLDPARRLGGRFWGERVVHVPSRGEPSREVDYVAGACLLTPREALARVGPLDERFFLYFEETDWCRRARAAGLAVWYCAEAEIVHLEGRAAATVSDFSLRQFQHSYRLFLRKHHGRGREAEVRLAQACEYGLKSLLRGLAALRGGPDGDANRALARQYGTRARLQFARRLDPRPPA
ncbi:glycosyltransferase family 2 protein [bacterium]|nr:glycosyltransferase family 2 protein [bacterium]